MTQRIVTFLLAQILLAGLLVLLALVSPDPMWIAGVYDGADGDDLAASVELGGPCSRLIPSGRPAAGSTVRSREPADDPRAAAVLRVRAPPAR